MGDQMSRRTFTAAVATTLIAAGIRPSSAQVTDPRPPTVDTSSVKEVADGVFIVPDRRVWLVPNIGIVLGRDAALVIDTGLGPANGERVLDLARRFAGSRRLMLTLTHFPPEHGYGAQVFRPDATIVVNRAQQDELAQKGEKFGVEQGALVAMTPQGAFVLGNPRAKVRLVEYLSMTCAHCAAFTGESLKPLTDRYVRQGLVSIEVRHAIRDSLDVAASLLVRCGGARTFFADTEAVLAAQDQWLRDAIAFQEADQGATGKLPLSQALAAFAHGAGLDRIMASRGLSAAQANACLADKREQDRLVAMAKEAWSTRGIAGTPAFLINGTPAQGASSWAALEPKLREALR